MQDRVPLQRALVVEVEVLEHFPAREPGGFDAALAAVVLAGGDFAFEAGGQEFLMGPAFGAGPFPEPADRSRQRRGSHGPAQVGEIGVGLGRGAGHHATPSTRS